MNSREFFLLANYLVANGFNVIRFDARNNVGLSSGSIEYFTMGQIEDDLELTLRAFGPEIVAPIVLVTQSLSFPVGLRYSLRDNGVSKIIGIVGVVNAKDTVERIIECSLDPYVAHVAQESGAPRLQCIFGHFTDAQHFVDDMVGRSFSGLPECLALLQQKRAPVCLLSSRSDEYVNFEEVQQCVPHIIHDGEFVVMDEMSHMIGRSLAVAKRLAQQAVKFAVPGGTDASSLVFPKLTDAIRIASSETDFFNECEQTLESMFRFARTTPEQAEATNAASY
jgi:hypothetical protein